MNKKFLSAVLAAVFALSFSTSCSYFKAEKNNASKQEVKASPEVKTEEVKKDCKGKKCKTCKNKKEKKSDKKAEKSEEKKAEKSEEKKAEKSEEKKSEKAAETK